MSAEALLIWEQHAQHSVGGIMVSIAAFQAVDPGSIPGRRNIFSFFFAQKPLGCAAGYHPKCYF